MTPVKTFITIAAPCAMTGTVVHLSTSPAHLVAGLSIVTMITLAIAYLVSWLIEWARQDAVRTSTVTLVAELNERNTEAAALRRRLEIMRRSTQ